MKILKIYTTIFLFLFLIGTIKAQTERTIEEIAKKHQDCLDSGVDMLDRSKNFYFNMDSMLNIVYKKLRANMNKTGKGVLKAEQLAWLKKRDNYFETQNKESQEKNKKGEWGADMVMITYDNDAEFIKARILNLIRKLNNSR